MFKTDSVELGGKFQNNFVDALNACLEADINSVARLAANEEPQKNAGCDGIGTDQQLKYAISGISRRLVKAIIANHGYDEDSLNGEIEKQAQLAASYGLSVKNADLVAFAKNVDTKKILSSLEHARYIAKAKFSELAAQGLSDNDFFEQTSNPAIAIRRINSVIGEDLAPSPLELMLSAMGEEHRIEIASCFSQLAVYALEDLCVDMRKMRGILLRQQKGDCAELNSAATRIRGAIDFAQQEGCDGEILTTMALLASPDWESNTSAVTAGQKLCRKVILSLDIIKPEGKNWPTGEGNPDKAVEMVLSRVDRTFSQEVVEGLMSHKSHGLKLPSQGAIIYSHGFDELGAAATNATTKVLFSDRVDKQVRQRVYEQFCDEIERPERLWSQVDYKEYLARLDLAQVNLITLEEWGSVKAHCGRILERIGDSQKGEIAGVQIIASENAASGDVIWTYKIALVAS